MTFDLRWALRSLTYQPAMRQVVGTLRLRGLARLAYYYASRPSKGILELRIGSVKAKFYVPTAQDLRAIETDIFKEREILEQVVCSLSAGEVAYDVGANVGLYSILLGKAVGVGGQVIAFEPVSENCQRLRENLELNLLPNVRLIPKALSDWTGDGTFGDMCGTSQGPSLVRRQAGSGCQPSVEVVEGDVFREGAHLPVPQAVKIDVEGSEQAVLSGLRQTLADARCKLLVCEIHPQLLPARTNPEQVLALVRSLGFSKIELCPCRGRVEYHAVCRKPEEPVAKRIT